MARVFPLPSVLAASGVSPVGLVFTVTWASETGAPFLVTVISTTCSWLALSFACFALTSTFSSPVAGDELVGGGVLADAGELLARVLLALLVVLGAGAVLAAGAGARRRARRCQPTVTR